MDSNEDLRSRLPQFAYLDLLATTITEHEKNLDRYVKRLEEISKSLSKVAVEARSKESVVVKRSFLKDDSLETIVYMKLKASRPTEELTLILNSLKE